MEDKEYKVVFQLSNIDLKVYQSVIKQVRIVQEEIPAIKVEVVT